MAIAVAFAPNLISKNIVKTQKIMELSNTEVKKLATEILSGMLANPHVYPMVSDDLGRGPREQDLIIASIEMAESLISHVESRNKQKKN